MAVITDELKEQAKSAGVLHLVTASRAGVPNAAPMGAIWIMDGDTVWVSNNFMNKSASNIKENPNVSVLVWSREIGNCFQLKGTAAFEEGTEDHKKMKEMLDAMKPGLPGKALLKITVQEVFTCMPGPAAGSKIA